MEFVYIICNNDSMLEAIIEDQELAEKRMKSIKAKYVQLNPRNEGVYYFHLHSIPLYEAEEEDPEGQRGGICHCGQNWVYDEERERPVCLNGCGHPNGDYSYLCGFEYCKCTQ